MRRTALSACRTWRFTSCSRSATAPRTAMRSAKTSRSTRAGRLDPTTGALYQALQPADGRGADRAGGRRRAMRMRAASTSRLTAAGPARGGGRSGAAATRSCGRRASGSCSRSGPECMRIYRWLLAAVSAVAAARLRRGDGRNVRAPARRCAARRVVAVRAQCGGARSQDCSSLAVSERWGARHARPRRPHEHIAKAGRMDRHRAGDSARGAAADAEPGVHAGRGR